MHQFDLLSAGVENIETLNADDYIKGLALYFSLWIRFQNKSAQCAAEWKNEQPKSKRYAARLIYLNEYLASLLWANLADKIDVTELIEINLNSMPISWF